MVMRERVLATLGVGDVDGGVTVVTAPAGYGKSVVVTQWAARHDGPVRILRLRRDHDAKHVAAQLAELEQTDDGALAFESIDLPTDPGVMRIVVRHIEQAPTGTHVVITRRSAAPGPLDRVLEERGVTHLDHRDLRFDREEARQLLTRAGMSDVTGAEIDAVLRPTHGWPVAARLAAAEMQRDEPHRDVSERIRGVHPQLEGFLRGEVLDALPERSRRFLVRTSVLPDLIGPLCEAVVGEAGADALLVELERDGLVLAAAPEGVWRCHPLLQQLLRRELRASATDDEAQLLQRAAAWHLDRGDVQLAGDLLVEAERWSALLALVDRHGRAMAERGEADPVLAWLAAIPTTGALWRRSVVLRRAVLLTLLGRSHLAEQVIHDSDLSSCSTGEQAVLDALRSAWGFVHGAPEVAIRSADAVLAVVDQLGPGDVPNVFGLTSAPALEHLVRVTRARSRWLLGETAASRGDLLHTLRLPSAYVPWRIQSLAGLAMLEAWSGNLRAADRHAREGWRIARETHLDRHPAVVDVMLARAHVLRERGQLAASEELLDATKSLATEFRRSESLTMLAVERALWHLAAGHPGVGLEVIEELGAVGPLRVPPTVAGRVAAVEVRLHLANRDPQRAGAVPLDAVHDPAAAGARVQLALLQDDVAVAADIVGAWPAGDDPRASIERDLWTAVLEFHAGERRAARQRIAAVVGEAQPEGHVRLFLDGGELVQRLLRALAATSESVYVVDLVGVSTVGAADELGLSRREVDVLRYLPTPLSNAEIAANLYISLNTLKTHLHAVYRKLDVTGRREAIERAEQLGIA